MVTRIWFSLRTNYEDCLQNSQPMRSPRTCLGEVLVLARAQNSMIHNFVSFLVFILVLPRNYLVNHTVVVWQNPSTNDCLSTHGICTIWDVFRVSTSSSHRGGHIWTSSIAVAPGAPVLRAAPPGWCGSAGAAISARRRGRAASPQRCHTKHTKLTQV